MKFPLFLTIVCSTATAGILPRDSTELDLLDLLDLPELQTPPSLGTTIPDNTQIYASLPLSNLDSPFNALTLPDSSDRGNDDTSFKPVDPKEPGSISVASADLGVPEIQAFNSDIVKPSISNGDEPSLITAPNPGSDGISSPDPSFIGATARSGADGSRRICRPGNPATSTKEIDTSQMCEVIDLRPLTRNQINYNTPDKGYSPVQEAFNNALMKRDKAWEDERRKEGHDNEYSNDEGWDRCKQVKGNHPLPVCSMGPYTWFKYDGTPLQRGRNDKRDGEYSLHVENSIIYFPGRPRCEELRWQFCCRRPGGPSRWGFWGIDCILMNP